MLRRGRRPPFSGANYATNHLHRHDRCHASYRSLGGSAATVPAIPKTEHCEVPKALSSQVPKALSPKVSEAALIFRAYPYSAFGSAVLAEIVFDVVTGVFFRNPFFGSVRDCRRPEKK
jgi:hypothetical protein